MGQVHPAADELDLSEYLNPAPSSSPLPSPSPVPASPSTSSASSEGAGARPATLGFHTPPPPHTRSVSVSSGASSVPPRRGSASAGPHHRRAHTTSATGLPLSQSFSCFSHISVLGKKLSSPFAGARKHNKGGKSGKQRKTKSTGSKPRSSPLLDDDGSADEGGGDSAEALPLAAPRKKKRRPQVKPDVELPHDPSTWTVEDVIVWLDTLGLSLPFEQHKHSATRALRSLAGEGPSCQELFKSHGINGRLLLELGEELLRDEIGIVRRLDRLKILIALEELKSRALGRNHDAHFIKVIRFQEFDNVTTFKEGQFGVVFRAKWQRQGHREVVIKVPKTDSVSTEWNELRAFVEIPPHPNVLPLLGICTDFEGYNKHVCFVTEYVEQGSLKDVLTSPDRSPILELLRLERMSSVFKLAVHISQGLLHLHQNGMVHRDVALRNVLISRHGAAQVCDFGLARSIGAAPGAYYQVTNSNALPVRWMAAESMSGTFTRKSDVWMFGVTLWELLTGGKELPYAEESNPLHIIAGVVTGKLKLDVPEPAGADEPGSSARLRDMAFDLVKQCCDMDASKRPTMHDVVITLQNLWKTAMMAENHREGPSLAPDDFDDIHDDFGDIHSEEEGAAHPDAFSVGVPATSADNSRTDDEEVAVAEPVGLYASILDAANELYVEPEPEGAPAMQFTPYDHPTEYDPEVLRLQQEQAAKNAQPVPPPDQPDTVPPPDQADTVPDPVDRDTTDSILSALEVSFEPYHRELQRSGGFSLHPDPKAPTGSS